MKNRNYLLPLTICAALALTACGGGGGNGGTAVGAGSNPAPTQNTPTTTLTGISATNSSTAASNAYAAYTSINESSTSVTSALTGVSVNPATINAVSPAIDLIKRAYSAGAPKFVTGIGVSQACSGGGTLSVSGTVQNQDVASNGDTITFATVNCVEGGMSLNGGFTVKLGAITGIPFSDGTWNVTADIQFNAFSVAIAGEGVEANGDMKIVMSATPTGRSVAISGTSFQGSPTKAGVKLTTRKLSNYFVTGNYTSVRDSSTANYTFAGNTGKLGQFEYTVKNLEPFISVGSNNPTSGSMIITGASSSVTMTVIDANNVRLEYSAKGDGVITQTSTVSWATFRSDI